LAAVCPGVVFTGSDSVSAWRLQEHPPISNSIAASIVPRIAIPFPVAWLRVYTEG
jgi:hypothetical protein